ncbi:hypothetical protein GGX14DRAFT_407814 [Mycena pura]|uniref:Small secreted protein n=1 Tax=Mycena pura TaxID=153505 RepID=A0AAD6Y428_9AGAR|nr:hypothetical protein GGX14DRAFT_407814 [Mycena pura]
MKTASLVALVTALSAIASPATAYFITFCPDAEEGQGAQTDCTAFMNEPSGGCQNLPSVIAAQASSVSQSGVTCTYFAGANCQGDAFTTNAMVIFDLGNDGFNDRIISFKCD